MLFSKVAQQGVKHRIQIGIEEARRAGGDPGFRTDRSVGEVRNPFALEQGIGGAQEPLASFITTALRGFQPLARGRGDARSLLLLGSPHPGKFSSTRTRLVFGTSRRRVKLAERRECA